MATSTIKGDKLGTFTAKNGFTASETRVRQSGALVNVKGYVTKASGTGTDEIQIGDIGGVPAPPSICRTQATGGNAAYNAMVNGYCYINTSGTIGVKFPSSVSTVVFNITYSL